MDESCWWYQFGIPVERWGKGVKESVLRTYSYSNSRLVLAWAESPGSGWALASSDLQKPKPDPELRTGHGNGPQFLTWIIIGSVSEAVRWRMLGNQGPVISIRLSGLQIRVRQIAWKHSHKCKHLSAKTVGTYRHGLKIGKQNILHI